MSHHGTLQRCDCCNGSAVGLAMAYPQDGVLVVRKRSNGTHHTKEFDLRELVTMLDPKGTSFTAVR